MEFEGFPKIPRLFREIVITEKIDGTNAQIVITEGGEVLPGSKNRFIDVYRDNHGFAVWVRDRESELRQLGVGKHFGEFWGSGIGRGYGMREKHLSLFNVKKWLGNPMRPACCDVVPVIAIGPFDTDLVQYAKEILRKNGSMASPGYLRPEGVVVYHTAGNFLLKSTIEDDDVPKEALRVARS